jgi:16S rRNA (guanine1207-N2)-methyltransferase
MSHYFTNDNQVKSDIHEHKVNILEKSFTFYTDNGVFSKKGLDFGTRTLLETISKENIKGSVLDFGCGYGPIGIYLKKTFDVDVDMVDINQRSVSLAKKNAILNDASVHVFESDIYRNVIKTYDYIVSNPPIRVGKEILYKILFEASEHLNQNGELWIVINKDQGAISTMKALEEKYEVRLAEKNKGFFVIVAKKR